MIVDLTEIEGSSRQLEFSIPQADLDFENSSFRLTDDVRVTCEVAKRAAQIDLRGSILADMEIECTRCLEPVSEHVPIEFVASFVTPENFSFDKERGVSAEDLDTDVLDSDRVDLKELVREQILLNLPEQVFCRQDCKGLCPKCGADRNLIDCKCDLKEPDPRWSALKNLGESK